METNKKLSKKELFINQIMTNKANAEREDYKDITIVKHSINSVAIWEYKSAKPTFHFFFSDDVKRCDFINERKRQADRREADEQKRMNEYEEKKKLFEVGSILYCSWGYEQTNIDWYIVLERKNDYVLIQEIGAKKTYDNNYNDRGECLPDPSIKIGEPFKKKITKYASIDLASYKCCTLWDGRSKSWSSYA